MTRTKKNKTNEYGSKFQTQQILKEKGARLFLGILHELAFCFYATNQSYMAY